MTAPHTEAPAQEPFDDVFKKRIAKLEADAKAVGLNFTSICKQAGFSRATPDRWKRGVPKTIQIVVEMERIVAERAATDPLAPH